MKLLKWLFKKNFEGKNVNNLMYIKIMVQKNY